MLFRSFFIHPVHRVHVELVKSIVKQGCGGPLAEGKHGIFTDPELTAIGSKYGKTAAQVVLKWNVQRGVSIIPKSVHVNRMEQNMDIWDFTLTEEEMAKIAAKDLGHSEIVNHADPAFVKLVLNLH